ncbi:replication-associated recombination protein A [Nitrosophilus kaiyonis]|uniref:replication-associated recombination protein A n=1 Tax=Nitrosophilus kaiyonis TaxID=2930200 RepID=UPI0024908D95|nr:replication-associated recombination protein A [Nitrosophilus kaiyonis]
MDNFANRLRPKKLEEFVGQNHLISKNAPFYKLIISKKLPHTFFWGPPGTGKTTLARIIASYLGRDFYFLDATSLKVDDIRKIVSKYKNSLTKPLIFIDEVHRLSKTQQEVLLPIMEKNEALILGASTENPYFSLTAAIRSRSFLFEFKPLSDKDLEKILKKAQEIYKFEIDNDAKEYLIRSSNHDARSMLNLLEAAFNITKKIDLQTLLALKPKSTLLGISSKEEHYNLISAFIKSIRGSDIDASIYYLARLVSEAEPPEFIARRLVILASEDIGNANPNALNIAVNTLEAVKNIGYPEAKIILSQCVIYLASSPKSNSAYLAIKKAIKSVENGEILPIPTYLKSPSPKGYFYPHDFGGYVKQKYLTKDLKFYESKNIGFEKTLNEWLEKIKKS